MLATELMQTLKCVHNGCSKEYTSSDNVEGSCQYHPGVAEFHEGRKGWTCCSKRVDDFDEFLKIPGCATGIHTDSRPKEPKDPKDQKSPAPDRDATAKKIDTTEGTGVEKAASSVLVDLPPVPAASARLSSVAEATAEAVTDESLLNDPEDAVVTDGTVCKRQGCKTAYKKGLETSECYYHKGQPIFHEGSKGWTCCGRKYLEFSEFLKVKGCQKASKHRFLDVFSKKVSNVEKKPSKQVRHDWYQTQSLVILSLFVKKCDPKRTSVKFDYWSLSCEMYLLSTAEDDKAADFYFQIPLSQPIDPLKSKFKVLGTKVELELAKANGISWATLEPPKDGQAPKSWTTFGTTGFVGSVGAKDPIVCRDSPLYACNSK